MQVTAKGIAPILNVSDLTESFAWVSAISDIPMVTCSA
jgi:hypothetical protein